MTACYPEKFLTFDEKVEIKATCTFRLCKHVIAKMHCMTFKHIQGHWYLCYLIINEFLLVLHVTMYLFCTFFETVTHFSKIKDNMAVTTPTRVCMFTHYKDMKGNATCI